MLTVALASLLTRWRGGTHLKTCTKPVISPPAYSNESKSPQKETLLPLFHLKGPPKAELQAVTHAARCNPTDQDSPKYKVTCTILKGGGCSHPSQMENNDE